MAVRELNNFEYPEPEQISIEHKSVTKVYTSGCSNYLDEVSKYDWDVDIAMSIMKAESGCNPNALNREDSHNICTGSAGLFQISCHSGLVFDPVENIRIAYYDKYSTQRGWGHWSVCTNGMVNCGL